MKSIRETFLADEGCNMLRVDYAQIEHRFGLMYCGTDRMVEMANVNPEDYDAFTEGAKDIFGVEEVTKQMRYLTKKVFHASWRGMGGDKMSESVSKDTDGKLFVSPKECQGLIDKHLKRNPEIIEVYMPWCRKQVREVGVLRTSWGRRLDLRRRRIDDDLYRIAYSFYLQAEAADMTNQYGFLPGSRWMQKRYGKPLNAQVHDEIIASIPIGEEWEFAEFIVGSMETAREVPGGSGKWVTIPAEVTVGRSWGDPKSVEFKKLPGREEFKTRLKEGGF